jgi:hypothetical protein
LRGVNFEKNIYITPPGYYPTAIDRDNVGLILEEVSNAFGYNSRFSYLYALDRNGKTILERLK